MEMKMKSELAREYNATMTAFYNVCEEIAARINLGDRQLAFEMLGERAEQVGKLVEYDGETDVMKAIHLGGGKFDIQLELF
jgi:hypothetical protein